MDQNVSFVAARGTAVVNTVFNMIIHFIAAFKLPERIYNYAVASLFKTLMHMANILSFIFPASLV